ncbi:hypothetical protein ACNKHS_15490 [Shigella flexneri]
MASQNHIVTALDIMTEGPLGGAVFRVNLVLSGANGYFRTYEEKVDSHNGEELRGYHKPIMLAADSGTFAPITCRKARLSSARSRSCLAAGMNIGPGGGAAFLDGLRSV